MHEKRYHHISLVYNIIERVDTVDMN